MIAFITIDVIDKQTPGYIHLKDKSQKAWNCNKPELFTDEQGNLAWRAGTRLKIDYAEGQLKPGFQYPPKYINNARPARDDEQDTWPAKEPYRGGGGGNMKKDDYDPEVGKRQTAANCAMDFFANQGATIADLEANFETVANIVLDFVNGGAPKSDNGGADSAGSEDFGSEDVDF